MSREAHVGKAIALLNEAQDLLERTMETDLQDASDEIGPVLLAIEDWQRRRLSGLAEGEWEMEPVYGVPDPVCVLRPWPKSKT